MTGHGVLDALVWDAIAALHWLASRYEHPPLAIVGHSLGGHIALHAALAWQDRLPVVLASCAGRYETMFSRSPSATAAHVLPGIYQFLDVPDLFGALTPAPVQIQHGIEDPFFPVADARAVMDAAAQVYAKDGSNDRIDTAVLEMGHGADLQRAYEFLDEWVQSTIPARLSVPAGRVLFDSSARAEILESIDDSLSRGGLTLGPHTARFERALQPWVGTEHVVAVSSGSAALEIALRSLNVAGRTVLVPANTFLATATAAMHAGASVRFVDIELESLGMDPEALRKTLDRESNIAAVVVVHIAGMIAPSVIDVIHECDRRGIPVVEDAAHALGSALDDSPAGSLGRLAAFSFYPTKVITSGEGGAVCTRDGTHADFARCVRDQGKRSFEQNVHTEIGSNWRLSEPHAAIGCVHLKRLAAFIEERSRLAARYDERLADVRGIRPVKRPARCRSNFYKYIAILDSGIRRDEVRRRLAGMHRVALSGEVYPIPCPHQPALHASHAHQSFPAAEQFCQQHVCLPLFAGMTDRQQNLVVEALRETVSVLAINAKDKM